MKRCHAQFFVACLLATLAGCSWESSAYQKYVSDSDKLSPCTGHCDTLALEITSKEACENFSGEWIEAECLDPETPISDDESIGLEMRCLDAKGTFQNGYCSNIPSTACEVDKWYEFSMKELDDGNYIRKIDNEFKCGDYNAVISGNSSRTCSSQEINDFQMDLDYKLCNKNSACQLAYYRNPSQTNDLEKSIPAHTAMCSSCGEGMAICITDNKATCTDIINNSAHCGACNHACGSNYFCQDGRCIDRAKCGKDQIKCYCTLKNMQVECTSDASETADFQCFDRNGNETCGITTCEQFNTPEVQCNGDKKCQNIGTEEAPSYACQCPTNTVELGDLCVSPLSEEYCGITAENPKNYAVCKDGRICDGIKCQCPSGTQECDGKCIDTKTTNEHCGACDNKCGNNETCTLSSCKCNSGGRCGGDICKDNSNDHDHCGGKGECNSADVNSENYQGLICGEREICENNNCKCDTSKYAFCNGTCIDPMTDNAFCGADANCSKYENCNTIQGASCISGKCECPEGMTKMKTVINDVEVYKCFDTQNDPTCCGGKAGDICTNCGNMLCVNGQCKDASCEAGTINCQNRCLNPDQYHVQQVSVQAKTCKCYKDSDVEYCDDDDNITNGCPDQKVGDVEHCFGCGNACAKGYTACIKENGNPKCACQADQTFCNYGSEDNPEIHCYTPEDMQNLHLRGCEECAEGWGKSPDTPWSEGCQIDILHTTEHCGRYGNDCNQAIQNATSPWCNEGICDYKDCIDENHYNCDTDRSHGCRSVLTSSQTCGKCNISCSEKQSCQNKACCYNDGEEIDKSDNCCHNKYKKFHYYLLYWYTEYKCSIDPPGSGWEKMQLSVSPIPISNSKSPLLPLPSYPSYSYAYPYIPPHIIRTPRRLRTRRHREAQQMLAAARHCHLKP